MNAQDQTNINRLNQLFALPPAEWAAVEQDAIHLLDQLAATLGEDHQQVKELDGKLNTAHAASERWKKGSPGTPAPTPAPAPPPAELPAVDPTLFQAQTHLGAALRALRDQGRFEFRKRLQAGNYSAGYSALDRETQAHVVVKLPTDAENAWSTRFKECDDALAAEATILPLSSRAIAAAPAGSARPVAHAGAGTLNVSAWPYPVHWLAQRFAQGRRVSDLVPLRDTQEPEGLQILHQVTTMVRLLYQNQLAHLDLKEDALFWDGTQVEVIDWNRAAQRPSAQDLRLEFEGLLRLVSTIFFGPTKSWGDPDKRFAEAAHADAWALLVAFSGRPLSRGVRSLLFRSLCATYPDPEASTTTAKYSEALTTLEALHAAIAEQTAYWAQRITEPPVLTNATPRSLAALLDQLSVEVQRPAAQSRALGKALDWLLAAYAQAQQEVDGYLRQWLSVPENLRVAFRKLEEVWFWLPDIWPLALVVPLSKLWFRHITPKDDESLLKLVGHLVTNEFAAAATLARQLAAMAPKPSAAPLAALLEQTAKSAEAYLTLAKLEQALADPQLDYAAALRSLTQVREVIPAEPRTLKLDAQLSAGDQRSGRIFQLQAYVKELRERQPPSSRTQRELLVVLHDLRELSGSDDQRYAVQQQVVALLDQAEAALAAAEQVAANDDWAAVRTHLAPWTQHADLSNNAPDVVVKVAALDARAERRLSARCLGDFLAQVQVALERGELALAQHLCGTARQTFAGNVPVLDQIGKVEQALKQIAPVISQLQQGGETTAKLPELDIANYPAVCYSLGYQINTLIRAGRKISTGQTLADGLNVLKTVQQDVAPPLVHVQRRLARAACKQVLAFVGRRLGNGTPLTAEEQPTYETALQQVQAADEPSTRLELLTIQAALARQRDQGLATAVQTGLTATLSTSLQGLATDVTLSRGLGGLATDATLTGLGRSLGGLATNAALSATQQAINVQITDLTKAVKTLTEKLAGGEEKEGESDDSKVLSAWWTQAKGKFNQGWNDPDTLVAFMRQERPKALTGATFLKLDALADTVNRAKQADQARRTQEARKEIQAALSIIEDPVLGSSTATLAGLKNMLEAKEEELKPTDLIAWLNKYATWLLGVVVVLTVIVVAFVLVPRMSQTASGTSTPTPATSTVVVTPGTIAPITPLTTTATMGTTTTTGSAAPNQTPSPSPTPVITSGDLLVAQLGQAVPITVTAETASFTLGETTLPLTVTVGTGNKLSTVLIPETLLVSFTSDFALPTTGTLQIAGQEFPRRIDPSVLTVGTLTEVVSETLMITMTNRQVPAAYLWHEPTVGALPEAAIKVKGALETAKDNYAVLLQGDTVRVLGGKGEFYEVEIVTNKLDRAKAVGQRGWIRKTLVHGGGGVN